MRELQEKQRLKRVLYSKPALVIFFLVVVSLAQGALGVIGKERESAKILENLENEVETLSIREEELKNEVRRLGTEEGINAELKGKFNVALDGESFVVVVDPREDTLLAKPPASAWHDGVIQFIVGLWPW